MTEASDVPTSVPWFWEKLFDAATAYATKTGAYALPNNVHRQMVRQKDPRPLTAIVQAPSVCQRDVTQMVSLLTDLAASSPRKRLKDRRPAPTASRPAERPPASCSVASRVIDFPMPLRPPTALQPPRPLERAPPCIDGASALPARATKPPRQPNNVPNVRKPLHITPVESTEGSNMFQRHTPTNFAPVESPDESITPHGHQPVHLAPVASPKASKLPEEHKPMQLVAMECFGGSIMPRKGRPLLDPLDSLAASIRSTKGVGEQRAMIRDVLMSSSRPTSAASTAAVSGPTRPTSAASTVPVLSGDKELDVFDDDCVLLS